MDYKAEDLFSALGMDSLLSSSSGPNFGSVAMVRLLFNIGWNPRRELELTSFWLSSSLLSSLLFLNHPAPLHPRELQSIPTSLRRLHFPPPPRVHPLLPPQTRLSSLLYLRRSRHGSHLRSASLRSIREGGSDGIGLDSGAGSYLQVEEVVVLRGQTQREEERLGESRQLVPSFLDLPVSQGTGYSHQTSLIRELISSAYPGFVYLPGPPPDLPPRNDLPPPPSSPPLFPNILLLPSPPSLLRQRARSLLSCSSPRPSPLSLSSVPRERSFGGSASNSDGFFRRVAQSGFGWRRDDD